MKNKELKVLAIIYFILAAIMLVCSFLSPVFIVFSIVYLIAGISNCDTSTTIAPDQVID